MHAVIRFLLVLVLASWSAPSIAVDEIPVEDFFKRPKFSSFQLSPNGKYLAAIVPLGPNQRRNIAVLDLETRAAVPVTSIRESDVSAFLWANDKRIIFQMDTDGNESFGIFAVDRDGADPKTLIKPAETQIQSGSFVVRTAYVLNRLKYEDDFILVSTPRLYRNRVIQDVQRMHIYTGHKAMVERNPGDIAGWIYDDRGFVFGAARTEGTKSQILYRPSAEAPWAVIHEAEVTEPGFVPVWASNDRSRMYISSRLTADGKARDKAAIYAYDIENRQIGDLIFEHPDVDVGGVIGSDVSDDIVGVAYEADIPAVHYIDEQWATIQASLEQLYPGKIVSLTSVTEDESQIVVRVWDSTDIGTYFLLDRERMALEELAVMADWLDPDALSPVKSVTIVARDGLRLPAYLVVPRDSEAAKLPLIINPHGGPRARDVYGFDPFSQLLANRGYAVLKVNFRGSTGYGQSFDEAGWRQWGLKMQDDITDAVMWAIDEGIADPDRVCIFGASYGGYAAMAGLVFTPEIYQCGVNYVGVTDIELLFKTMPRSWEQFREIMEVQIGDPKADRAMLRDRSPVNHVEKIQAPILMAYGKQDPRVVLEHAFELEKQLKKHKKPYELIIKRKEGHGFRKFENQVEFANRVVEFLDLHLAN
jgi:dipeptidyl aminopeptidase/acylaminoacyl peptidase